MPDAKGPLSDSTMVVTLKLSLSPCGAVSGTSNTPGGSNDRQA